MKVENLICCFDFETNSLNIETCEPIEVACIFLDPFKLTPIQGSEFSSLMRPTDLDTLDDTDEKKNALKISGITKELLRDQPVKEAVISAFASHIKRMCGKRKAIPAGFNISNFDIPLYDRLCRDQKIASKKDGKNPSFLTGIVMDCKEDINRLFFQDDRMLYTSFDSVRKLMGMDTTNVHRAMKDVLQEAWLVQKLLSLYQSISKKIKFEDCARDNGGILQLN